MALLNNNYIFVEDEKVTRDVEGTTHPVEKGNELTDHIRRTPVVLSLTGKIGNHKKGKGIVKAADILSNIEKLKNSGSLVTYIGRNALYNLQIRSFSTSHPNTVWGGCEFDMELVEVKIAKPAYQKKDNAKKSNVGTQQVSEGENKNVYHTVKKGDCVWNLVTKNYKSLEPKYSKTMDKCNWIMQQNPNAFSRKNDFGTLQVGKKLLVGYRK